MAAIKDKLGQTIVPGARVAFAKRVANRAVIQTGTVRGISSGGNLVGSFISIDTDGNRETSKLAEEIVVVASGSGKAKS